VVEAAGVEPASEKVNRKKATCVSGSVFFDHPIRHRQEGNGLAWLISGLGSRRKRSPYPAKWRSLEPAQAQAPERLP